MLSAYSSTFSAPALGLGAASDAALGRGEAASPKPKPKRACLTRGWAGG